MNILLTSGGTKVKIDSVRHIGNMSSGTFGSKIGFELARVGSEMSDFNIDFLYAKNSKTPFSMNFNAILDTETQIDQIAEYTKIYRKLTKDGRNKYNEIPYNNFDDYSEKLKVYCQSSDVVILAAAVSDYLVDNCVDGKIRSNEDLNIKLKPATKLISKIKEWNPNVFLVGFKLLVNSDDDELIQAAKDSIDKNGCDMVVANDLRDIKGNNHKLILVYPDGFYHYCYENNTHDNSLARYVSRAILSRKERIK